MENLYTCNISFSQTPMFLDEMSLPATSPAYHGAREREREWERERRSLQYAVYCCNTLLGYFKIPTCTNHEHVPKTTAYNLAMQWYYDIKPSLPLSLSLFQLKWLHIEHSIAINSSFSTTDHALGVCGVRWTPICLHSNDIQLKGVGKLTSKRDGFF